MLTRFRRATRLVLLCLPALGLACTLISSTDDVDGSGGSGGTGGAGPSGGTSSGGEGGDGGDSGSANEGGLSGGGEGGADPCAVEEETFDCPDYCTALQEGTCEKASGYDRVAVEECSDHPLPSLTTTRVTWATGSFRKACFYYYGHLAGARANLPNAPEACSSGQVTWGEQPTGCAELSLAACDADNPPPESPAPECYAYEPGSCNTCCPSEPVDCAETPDISCNTGTCPCHCENGEFTCPC